MQLFETVKSLQEARATWTTGKVGFVPTMGALHAGHLALIERARHDCEQVVVSIFVNPAQFNDPVDLESYPRPRERDLQMLDQAGVQAVFLPLAKEIYHDNYRFVVNEKILSELLCGAKRPGHFNGVLTVVLKLFNIVRPTKAYFGEKDFQQLTLIRDMVAALFLDIEVVACPTLRETDGLAMSSRNALLTPEQRALAPALQRVLRQAPDIAVAKLELQHLGFKVDYVEQHFGRRFVAAFLGQVRLIDNVEY